MIHFLLYITILTGGIAVGYLGAKPYENRVLHLEDLILTMKVLQAEMAYRRDPLPELLHSIGSKTSDKSGEFLTSVWKILTTEDNTDLYESWLKAVDKTYGESALVHEDRLILARAGIELGKTDLDNQEGLFVHLFGGLEKQIREAEEIRKTKGRVYRTLWTSAGILTIIILL
jgi:stage III sporulation protein AB